MQLRIGTAKALFFIGTLSSLVLFLAITVDTHRRVRVLTHVEDLSASVVAGKRVWQKYNCNDCHTILGLGGYYSPDLTRVYSRIGSTGIAERVRRPEAVLASSWRKMPQQHLQEPEIESLLAFFQWVDRIDTDGWPPQDNGRLPPSTIRRLAVSTGVSPGAVLLKDKGCLGCHRFRGTGSDAAPALDGVGTRYDRKKLADYIRDPQAVDAGSSMPKQTEVSAGEAEKIADFLMQDH